LNRIRFHAEDRGTPQTGQHKGGLLQMPRVRTPCDMADDGADCDADSATGQALRSGSFSVQAKARRPRGRRAFLGRRAFAALAGRAFAAHQHPRAGPLGPPASMSR
jgi:hypothetical protein